MGEHQEFPGLWAGTLHLLPHPAPDVNGPLQIKNSHWNPQTKSPCCPCRDQSQRLKFSSRFLVALMEQLSGKELIWEAAEEGESSSAFAPVWSSSEIQVRFTLSHHFPAAVEIQL